MANRSKQKKGQGQLVSYKDNVTAENKPDHPKWYLTGIQTLLIILASVFL